MNVQTFILFIVLTYASGQDRQIIPTLNPGCKTCTDENPLVYIKANSTQDAIHQIWDFTRGIPTVIYMIASSNSTLNITWNETRVTWNETRSMPSMFKLSERPSYMF
ncbi:Lysosomal protein NCU-G1-B [Operophtera brumata]|uniref:Lysosomal protein NCU-G1-B n=1 Tax=Operophtera brumata TaxID=104452 RepID=A0A0L7LGA2_OPEBR|nr:Lysosomal protein NCU-G1-B [Operophtera brumata]